ncbi:hypothetical protein HanPI659440_Chr05g0202281 [Helianthus annuus]|nr:hypothetical protein HanPI659440_Chr05g0202281 [Helianthus annuus]
MSAFLTVLNRCATMTVVLFTIIWSSASCTSLSDSASSALVASSKRRILGSLRTDLAIAILHYSNSDRLIYRELIPYILSQKTTKPSISISHAESKPVYFLHQKTPKKCGHEFHL